MRETADPRTDIGVALLLIVICGAVLWETRTIPPGVFEPLGSAPVPQIAAVLIILLCLLVLLRAVLRLRQWASVDQGEGPPHRLDAAVVFGLTVLYVLAMQLRLVTFAIMTAIFLFLTIGWLIRFKWKRLPVLALVAVITGFGCQYVFTRIFIVDLPGL
ncbi:MAG: tripartite tricarboxylate transporter TctB family protein [Candidatus Competibacteraceae bacterium]|jgi:cytochrome b561|nr:tripartite tricarboxylate transporter TctB family protein [Candidatus Competibacteraceae bacterium]MCB1804517.1 tripartite tricarboxylate transporter TctB family protein [Candidatus Competibacteraceae bacterium]MCB1812185.1 tripartite tricarboxylate transporter TctB family protein [Candidatus Competibacteraceae bacterium]